MNTYSSKKTVQAEPLIPAMITGTSHFPTPSGTQELEYIELSGRRYPIAHEKTYRNYMVVHDCCHSYLMTVEAFTKEFIYVNL